MSLPMPIFGLLIAICSLASQSATPAAEPASRLPNIIFIMADDLGYGDLSSYGQSRIRTPHLDGLAASGLRFTQAYAGSTVCAPSRCALMTGLHTGHCRIRGNARHPLEPEDVTVAEVLQQAGYRTALCGKWGLGEPDTTGIPNQQGFDYFFGYLNQRHAHNYYPTYLWENQEQVPLRNIVPNEDRQGGGQASEKIDYSHDLITEKALQFVRNHHTEPFFLYLALTIPHANNEAGKEGMEVPDHGIYQNLDWPEPQKGHAAMITRMDRDVGRLLALINQLGLRKNTVIFFTSDNGPHREGGNDPGFNDSNGPLRGIKRDLYEGGIRVPFFVSWPGRIQPGTTSDAPVYFPDVLPTAADIAGRPAPAPIDGRSFLPTLLGQDQEFDQRLLYWEFHERGLTQAARRGPWKAVRFGLEGPLELYHLPDDIDESDNLAPHHPEIVKAMHTSLDESRTPSALWPVKK